MPRLTARAFSEMLHLPGYEQQRILHEQKYPKQGPSVFKIPYYIPALSQIKEYYSNKNNLNKLNRWIHAVAPTISPNHKSLHNIRVVKSFISSSVSNRQLTPIRKQKPYTAFPHPNVELKLTFDLEVIENSITKYVIINCRNVGIDKKMAEDTIQIAHWVMVQSGNSVPLGNIEYWDLANNSIHTMNRILKRTITNMSNNATLVDAIWNSI